MRKIENEENMSSNIYTLNGTMPKSNNNTDRTTNENFNSSNFMGMMGSKIK